MVVPVAGQSIQDEIDYDVWHPFKKAYDSFDAEGQFGLHTPNVMRINRDAEYILVGDEYRDMLLQSSERNKARNAVRTIDFSFTERFHTGKYAFESGYYRVSYASDGLERITYGYFNCVLQKIDGTWKILADADTSQDGIYTEEDFMSGRQLGPPPKN